MTFVIPNISEVSYLEQICHNSSIRVRLFKSDITPSASHTLATYDGANEATFSGYAHKTAPFPGPAFTAGSGAAELISFDLVWIVTSTPSPSQTIYGYFLSWSSSTYLIGAERFASPVTLSQIGDKVEFAIKATLTSVG